jgi:pyruvate,water dikinase
MNRESEELFGGLPAEIEIPKIPFKRREVLPRFGLFALKAIVRRGRSLRQLDEFTKSLPGQVALLEEKVADAPSQAALTGLWLDEIEPLLRKSYRMLQAGTSRYENAYRPLHRELVEQVGEEDANRILSGVSGGDGFLASLGPLVGLWQVANGDLTRSEYLLRYGHRGPHEFELSWPRPAEDPAGLEEQMAALGEVDVPAMLERREADKQAAWERYAARFPSHTVRVEKKLSAAAAAARGREAVRSELTRVIGLVRSFALRAGELSGAGEQVFFLWLDELQAVLRGEAVPEVRIRARRQAHERLSALPPYPALIVGRFDPHSWAASPDRRSDFWDGRMGQPQVHDQAGRSDLVVGLPGSAGVAEGFVRRLASVDEGHLFKSGEVLVATTANVGWTPLFPRAAAIVTDVGAPLSHAAIVARELGIPAVVGTGDATMRLQDGDRVRVDGGRGTVEVIESS